MPTATPDERDEQMFEVQIHRDDVIDAFNRWIDATGPDPVAYLEGGIEGSEAVFSFFGQKHYIRADGFSYHVVRLTDDKIPARFFEDGKPCPCGGSCDPDSFI